MKKQLLLGWLCLCSLTSLWAQQRIQGTVSDLEKQPLIGATVLVKGTNIATITDYDGNFTLNINADNATIICSYIGYKPIEQKVKANQTIKITLEEDVLALGEVQVVAYGQQTKLTVTGAISSIGTKELLRSPAASVANILAGSISGISTVQYSGQPGADNPEIFVRGVSTLSASNSTPLIMVDGIERSFFNLDPNEIESISVLKDASATAVFGVRGANGVIIVTTRRGAEGPAKISFSTSVGTQQPTRLVDFCNSYDWATYYNEAKANDEPGSPGGFSPEAMEAFRTGSNPLMYPSTDWMDMLFKKNSLQSQHNVNISGGTKRVRYFTSLGYLSQDGMFRNLDNRYNGNFVFKRFNFRTNLDVDFTKTTRMNLNLGGRNEVRNQPNAGSDAELFRQIYWATPFSGAGIVDGRWIKKNKNYLPIGDNDALTPYYGKGYKSTNTNVLNIDLQIQQDLDFITKGLSVRIKGSYNGDYNHTKTRSASIAHYVPYYKKDLTWLDVPQNEGYDVILSKTGDSGTLSYSEGFGKGRNWYAEASFNYQRKFGNHDISGLLLYNQSRSYYPAYFTDIPSGYVGLVGRVTYNYKTRYLADINVGYNGSENFPKKHRYGLFPAFSAGWVVTNESFMEDQQIFDHLKLRLSFGKVGNDKDLDANGKPRRFLYLEGQYGGGDGYFFGTNAGNAQPGMEEKKLGNPNIGWETAYKQNYGIDAFFFNSRLGLNFDAFYERRNNILLTPVASNPAYHGMSLETLNLGIVENKGCEVTLKWKDKVGSDFDYNINLNLSFAKNKIINTDEAITPYDHTLKTGKPVGQNFGKKFVGFYYEGMEKDYNIASHAGTLYPGDCVYTDIVKDGVIDGLDDVAIGYPNYPLLNGGLSLGFTWKNLSFNCLFTGATMTSRLLSETFRQPMGDTNSRSLLQSQFDNRWTPETASTATEPRASFNSMVNNFRTPSDLWIRDASYLRLKNAEISYNFKFDFMKRLHINTLRMYVNGYNLFTIDKLKIADPETRTSDRPTYPAMRIFNVGLNVTF